MPLVPLFTPRISKTKEENTGVFTVLLPSKFLTFLNFSRLIYFVLSLTVKSSYGKNLQIMQDNLQTFSGIQKLDTLLKFACPFPRIKFQIGRPVLHNFNM